MMERLLDDKDVADAARRLRPDRDPEEIVARAAWSVMAEPGDGVAGSMIAAVGAAQALELALGEEHNAADATPAKPLRALREGRARWRPRARPEAVVAALSAAARIGARMLLPGDEDWPDAMDDLGAHAPTVLWVRGDAAALNISTRVSIVGARAASTYGETLTAEFAGDLARDGTLVVSGGAYGIDGAAHRAALGVGGKTVAFLAGGIDRAYPSGHQRLFDRILVDGAVLSEVPCGTAPTKWRFLSRNRLIAAIGQATVVVEAGSRSGSLNTAGHAATLGRPIGAVPGPVTSAVSAGCHRLLREYDAQCVTSTAEIRELMGISAVGAEDAQRSDPDIGRLLDAMSTRATHGPDELARRSGLSPERARSLLGILELEGRVIRRENGWVGVRSR